MKIRSKLLLLGIQGAIALAILGWMALNISDKGLISTTNVFKDSKQVQNLQTGFIEPIYQLRELSLSLVLAPNEDFRKSIDKKLSSNLVGLDKNFVNLSKDINAMWGHYKKLINITRSYTKEDFDEGAFVNVSTVERKQFYALIQALKELQVSRLEQSEETFMQAKDRGKENKIYIFSALILVSVLSLFIGYFVSKNIVFAIEKVEKGLSDFFEYLSNPKDKNADIQIVLDNHDELGKMAWAINRQITTIKKALKDDHKLIEEATYLVNEIKENKLDHRLQALASSKELNTLRDVMNEMIDNLESKIQAEIDRRIGQEKLLIQQSKLAGMGNMIGNIAHQWRQPICEVNAILMDLEVCARYDDLDYKYMIGQIGECYEITEYMSNTISDFQNFFKPSKKKESFSVHQACKNAASIIGASLKFHNIEFNFKIDQDSEILGYPNEFSQAILNILSNAKDVLIDRKVVSPQITLTINKGKQYTVIHIEDNGGGISSSNIDRIFEPYFTTKHAKQGTGIGLYMTKTIIENNMNGYVNVINSEKGAYFTIKVL